METAQRPVDVELADTLGLCVLRPLTPAGLAWLRQHAVAESWQWYGGGLCVDGHAYTAALVEGMREDGLTVAAEGSRSQ